LPTVELATVLTEATDHNEVLVRVAPGHAIRSLYPHIVVTPELVALKSRFFSVTFMAQNLALGQLFQSLG